MQEKEITSKHIKAQGGEKVSRIPDVVKGERERDFPDVVKGERDISQMLLRGEREISRERKYSRIPDA